MHKESCHRSKGHNCGNRERNLGNELLVHSDGFCAQSNAVVNEEPRYKTYKQEDELGVLVTAERLCVSAAKTDRKSKPITET